MATNSPVRALNSLQQQARFDGFGQEVNHERPHEALAMKTPGEVYIPSSRPYRGLPDLTYPLHDRDALVTACGRICMHRKKINISQVLAGQRVGIKEVDEGIWIIRFMHYDLGYIDLEQKTLQPLDNPFGARLLVLGTVCNPCLRTVHLIVWLRGPDTFRIFGSYSKARRGLRELARPRRQVVGGCGGRI